MADRMPSGKKIFSMHDNVLTEDEKEIRKVQLEDKVEEEITSANLRKSQTIKEVEEYNEDVLKVSKEIQNIKIHGNKILVRLFKHNPYKTGFYQPIMIARDRNDSGRYQMEEAALQFSPRGVIVGMSDTCSEAFKSAYKPGDVVDLVNGIGLGDYACLIDKTSKPKIDDINYFLFTENQVEKGFKDNLGLTVKFES